MRIKLNGYNISAREIDVLNVLWNAGKPLLASEIMAVDRTLKIATIHTALARMRQKRFVEIADFARSGNVFGRRYNALITRQDFDAAASAKKRPGIFSSKQPCSG